MVTSREWLTLLRQNKQNAAWFRQQSEPLYRDIERGLNIPSERNGFMQVFIQALPMLPMDYHLSPWLALSRHAVTVTYDLKEVRERCAALNAIGSFQVFMNATSDAEMSFTIAHEQADEINDRKAQIRAMIGYLWLQTQTKSFGYTYEHIPDILMYYNSERDNELSARLYQVIGALNTQFGEYDRSVSFSRFAHSFWRTRKNVVEQARTAYYLAVAYRELKQLETADYYLEQAAGLYADTNYIWQYMGITYEYGVHYYLEGDYDASLQWLEMTWAETQKLDDTHRHQRVLHCLGIVMGMFRHRLKEARGYLEQALKIAQHDHNDYDVAHIRHSLAFNTARSGDLAAARSEIEYGMQLAEAVTADHRRTRLKKVYGELLQMIENNDPRLRD